MSITFSALLEMLGACYPKKGRPKLLSLLVEVWKEKDFSHADTLAMDAGGRHRLSTGRTFGYHKNCSCVDSGLLRSVGLGRDTEVDRGAAAGGPTRSISRAQKNVSVANAAKWVCVKGAKLCK